MIRFWPKCVCTSILLPMLALGQDLPVQSPRLAGTPANADHPDRLPIKRVVLYKNGVGYFEHLGPVQGNQATAISFTSGQLNDVLKSLTVLDLNGGRISGVAYGSSAPVDRQMGDLRLPINEKSTLSEFLGSLRGARMEVKTAAVTLTGRMLSIERKTHMGGGTTLEVDYISLIADTGEVRTAELTPGFSVRLLDRGMPDKVGHYLDLVSSSREADVRRMVISTEGTGDRNLFVSYISEVPVWKATYRIVLNPKAAKTPLLQGWAIIDNTVGEDWNNVQLSLVAGAPQSFIQNLSQPYYSRRPVVPLPEAVNVSPQTFEATLIPGGGKLSGTVTDASGAAIPGVSVQILDPIGSVLAATNADSAGHYEFASIPQGGARLQASSSGFKTMEVRGLNLSNDRFTQRDIRLEVGSASEQITVEGAATRVQTSTSTIGGNRSLGSGGGLGGNANRTYPLSSREFTRLEQFAKLSPPQGAISAARTASESEALPLELGDLFEYKLKDPITIPKNRSAMVPIVQSAINAEKVSVWNEQLGSGRPVRALWLTNSSGLTLDGGTFSVLEEETFAGEGVFEPIRPDEKRLISYATDLALTAGARNDAEQQRVSHVKIEHGVMTRTNEIRAKRIYTLRNQDSSPRTVILEHPVRPGYRLVSEAKPAETTPAWMRFRVPIDPKQTASFVVEEARLLDSTYELTNLDSDQVALFVKERSINPAIEAALRGILDQKKIVNDLDQKAMAREEEQQKIFDDQQRLRENIKALKGSAEERALLQRYTRQLNDEEDRLEALKKEGEQIEARKDAEEEKLDGMIEALSFDEKL